MGPHFFTLIYNAPPPPPTFLLPCEVNQLVSIIQLYITYVTVEGRNQTLFTLSTFEKKSSKGRKFYCKASVMIKGKFD